MPRVMLRLVQARRVDPDLLKEHQMKSLVIPVAALGIALSAPAFAQSSGGSPASTQSGSAASSSHMSSSSSEPANPRARATAEKLKQDLQNIGFTDITVVAESFVVQAKTKDGDPVVMTIGPHGMTVFEEVNAHKSGSAGAPGSSSPGSAGGTSGSASPGPSTQK